MIHNGLDKLGDIAMMRWVPWLIRGKLEDYRLNLFVSS